MVAYLLTFLRLSVARLGLKRVAEAIRDERAVQALQRGNPQPLAARRVDLARHKLERRSVLFVLSSCICFLGWLLSDGMGWSRVITAGFLLGAIILFILSIVSAPSTST